MKQVCVGSGGVGFEVLKVVDERERLCAGISDRWREVGWGGGRRDGGDGDGSRWRRWRWEEMEMGGDGDGSRGLYTLMKVIPTTSPRLGGDLVNASIDTISASTVEIIKGQYRDFLYV